MVLIRISGLKDVRRGLSKFKKVSEKQQDKMLSELSKNLQLRIKRRAPKGTGWLKRSVMVEKKGKIYEVIIHAIYAEAIEKGSRSRWIPIEYLEQHFDIPEASGQRVNKPRRYVRVGGPGRPFIEPALKSFRTQMPRILDRYADKILNKSMGGKK